MYSELDSNNELSYMKYKRLCSACDFAYVEDVSSDNISVNNYYTACPLEKKEEEKLLSNNIFRWIFELLDEEGESNEDLKLALGLLFLIIVAVFYLISLYDKYIKKQANKNNKFSTLNRKKNQS